MARYIKDFPITVAPQAIYSAINQYLQSQGYEYVNYDGENVYKKGQGIWSNPTFFKFSYVGNAMRMETWMKYAFFPGVYVGELSVDGFVGFAVKGLWKSRIRSLEGILSGCGIQTDCYTPMSAQNNTVNEGTYETQLLNENDRFEETCILNEKEGEFVVSNVPVFCNECGTRLQEGTLFCSACGHKRPDTNVIRTATQSILPYQQPISKTSNYVPNEIPLPHAGYTVSRKEFINKYAQPSLRKDITNIAILCYVCAGLTVIMSCIINPMGIIDALVLTVFALGMHLAKSKLCAILILILSIIEVILSLISGAFPVWWLIAGVSSVITFNKIERQYKQFLNR